MKQRMSLLLEHNVISQIAFDATMRAVGILMIEWNVKEDSEQFQMAMTHFARAIDRVLQSNPIVEGLDSEILKEMQDDDVFSDIVSMNNQLCSASGVPEIPETEISFLLSNLYAIKLSVS